ncbi:virulence RhuM family protein [Corynebacterium sp. LK24]|uniref:virulence RhuM family protein n=1 Tax=Corynebacterium sp. LK24 TaxID=2044583 RepID=UPI001651FFB1|nr:virulence RhuM family protein [Corynebacterium sp. LK24]MBC6759230.1 cell filamentation protein Fic [Corynebacterium sp. LK24]
MSDMNGAMSMASAGELVMFRTDDGATRIEVRLVDETVWLTQAQMVELFQSSKANVSEHIRNVFAEGELEEDSVVRKFRTTAADGKNYQVKHYNLDVIISVGYRVRSLQGTQFRQWALGVLREYLIKGFAMDDERLKEGGGTYWRELLERIRDIRSSEKVIHRQVLDLYATSVDYDPRAAVSKQFFATVQNKLHFGAHGHTAAEVVYERSDAAKPNMGLTNWNGERITKAEVEIAKNYLAEDELKRLNTLVSAYFDAAEFRAQIHQPTYMADWMDHLTTMIAAMGGKSLEGAGTVSHRQAVQKAHEEYEKYKTVMDAQPSDVERDYLKEITAVQKQIQQTPKEQK